MASAPRRLQLSRDGKGFSVVETALAFVLGLCKIGVRPCVLLTLRAMTGAGSHQPVLTQNSCARGSVPGMLAGLQGWALWCFPELFSSLYPLPTLNVRLGENRKQRALGLG